MSNFSPLDPSLAPLELPVMQNLVKVPEEEIEQKKFESEMEKQRIRKTDADQKKRRKKEQEANEEKEKIIAQAQDLISKKESLYAIQKPDIKALLKKKGAKNLPEKNFTLPSLNSANLLFEQNDFSLNLSEPPAALIANQKSRDSEETSDLLFSSPSEEIPIDGVVDLTPNILPDTLEPPKKFIYKEELILSENFPVEEKEEKTVAASEKDQAKESEKPEFSLKKKQASQTPSLAESVHFSPFLFSAQPSLASSASSALRQLSADLFALFERMVGSVTLLGAVRGVSKTTINLNRPEFASSVFFGCRITIEECETAPKEFNIEFTGPPLAVAAFEKQKKELESAFTEGFAEGKFHFKVHRIESGLSEE